MTLHGCQFTKTTKQNLPRAATPSKVPHVAESKHITHSFSLELQGPVLTQTVKHPPAV